MEQERAPERGVVITGASSGIGRACALHLDRLGFRVFAGVRRDADGEALRSEASSRLAPLHLDVTDARQIAAAATEVAGVLGDSRLAGLVNNAGVALGGPLEFLPLDRFRRQLEINVVGQLAVTQAFLPLLRAGRGRVVTIGSISGRSSLPLLGPYAASKFALEALTDALRLELRPWGIEVAIVEPGSIATSIWSKGIEEANENVRAMPQVALDLYGRAIAALRREAQRAGAGGASPILVARAVEHALTAERPKTRYLVGRDARIRAALQLLPDRVRDRLILRRLS
ncbi:MAG: SDR family NAD(P)-dependent oxidoreductase [Chloroflexi bacterium]|nr:SDR family NAD(P)-dependent oxidoreductase [Chloroflexota bacterium]